MIKMSQAKKKNLFCEIKVRVIQDFMNTCIGSNCMPSLFLMLIENTLRDCGRF